MHGIESRQGSQQHFADPSALRGIMMAMAVSTPLWILIVLAGLRIF